jgi:hypothetical protein
MSNRHLFNPYNITDEIFNSKTEDFILSDSRALLSPYRIDLIAKFIYIESKEKKVNIEYAKELYKSHIQAFTHGRYKEQGQETTKSGIEVFYNILDQLIITIQEEGFNNKVSRIPIDKNGIIIDGAHRTAVCAYYNKPISVSQFDIEGPKYDFEFFNKRMMKSKYLDFMVHNYIKIKGKNLYALCLWPKAYENRDLVKEFLKANVKLVYEKQVSLTPRGAHSFVSQIYSHHDWVGTPKNGFSGSKNKVDSCFASTNPLVVFVFETEKSLDEIVALKEEFRKIVGLGKHSVHVTDNQNETIQISELLLNDNSIYHMNYANPFQYYKGIERLLTFRKLLKKQSHDSKEILIDGSGSLEVFGLRAADDIDYISRQDIHKGPYHSIRSKDELFKLYGKNIDSLQSPDSYFYFLGLRFLTLNEVLISKKRRAEKKDLLDAVIIESLLSMNRVDKYSEFKFNIRRKGIFLKKNFKNLVRKILKKLGIFNTLKRILKSK